MKLTITKEWFRSRAHLEEGHEIGAGSLQHIEQPTLHVVPSRSPKSPIQPDNVSFGQVVALMRRKRRWTINRLAEAAEATGEELDAIEKDPSHVPELSTVVSLATVFGLPPKALIQKSCLGTMPSNRVCEDGLRYAACSEFKEPLSAEEEHVLEAVLQAIVEHSDPQ